MKPHIFCAGGVWHCKGYSPRDRSRYVSAWGFTPVGAYNMWRTLAN